MTGKIRIIGGQWRGRKLAVPDRPGLRPTGDRARETLFNWLQPRLIGANCLDLFAGTGALGLEAASRGAARVVLIERDRHLAENLRRVAGDWPGAEVLEIVETDALAWLGRRGTDTFDVVFIDPPFVDGLQDRALDALSAGESLNQGAMIYVEQGVDDSPAVLPDGGPYTVVREKRLGRVKMTLLQFDRRPPL